MRVGLARCGSHRRVPRRDAARRFPAVVSLVVSDAVRAGGGAGGAARGRAPAAGGLGLGRGRGRGGDRRGDGRARDADPGRRRAGVPTFCEKPVAADIAGTRAVPERVAASEVPVQVGFQRRFDAGFAAARRRRVRGLARPAVHPAVGHARPGAAARRLHPGTSGGIFRDCSVHDFDALRWVSGREVRGPRHWAPTAATAFFAGTATSTPRRRCSPWTTARSPWSPRPATTPPATTSGWRCGRGGTIALGLDDRRRCGRWSRGQLPCRAAVPRLHGPLRRRVRGRAAGVPRRGGTRRHRARGAEALEALCRRGRPPVSRRAPHGAPRRGPPASGSSRCSTGSPARPSPGGSARCPAGATSCAGAGAGRDARGRPGRDRVRPGRVPARRPGGQGGDPGRARAGCGRRLRPGRAARGRARPLASVDRALDGFLAAGAGTLVLAADTGPDGYDARPELTTARLAARC